MSDKEMILLVMEGRSPLPITSFRNSDLEKGRAPIAITPSGMEDRGRKPIDITPAQPTQPSSTGQPGSSTGTSGEASPAKKE